MGRRPLIGAALAGVTCALALIASTGCSAPGAPGGSGAPGGAAAPPAGDEGGPRGAGTRRMAERLQALLRDVPPEQNIFRNVERVESLRGRLAESRDPQTFLDLQPKLAEELINAGRPEEALKELETLRQFAEKHYGFLPSHPMTFLRRASAVAWLRVGEQENCLARHTTESCLAPIRRGGVHTLARGSRAAIRVLEEQLREVPGDLAARWLLNIAYMTVGEYPDKVPRPWLIPPSAFASDAEVKRFTDVAPALGLAADDLAGGSIVDDFDGDGNLDIMASSSSMRGPLRYFRNGADGTFSERTEEAGLTGLLGGLNLIQADYDNDGDPDALVLRGGWLGKAGHHPNSLLRNDGEGTFEDVTEDAGVLSFHPTQTAVWLDYDGDGWLDLFIGNETAEGEVHPCELYHNRGDGTFAEVAADSGVAVEGFVKSVVSADYDNDGRPDLYLSLRDAPNLLFHNDGPKDSARGAAGGWRFTEAGARAGVTEPIHSFPAFFFDYDNDGWVDLFVSGYLIKDVGDIAADYLGLPGKGEKARLYRNNGDGTFRDVTRAARLDRVLHSMGSNFGDIDSDGWLDFYLGTGDPSLATVVPNRMFRNAEGRRFQDVTTSAGVGHLQKGHGISFADLDHDGDQDVYEVMGGAVSGDNFRNVLYENPGYGSHWIGLKLEGVRSNRAGVGARIKVTVRADRGTRAIHRTVGPGGSFGASPLRQEIGLGRARAVEGVEILWPGSGTRQVLRGLEMDRLYLVREGEAGAESIALKTFHLSDGGSR
jgi:hypothetical protein